MEEWRCDRLGGQKGSRVDGKRVASQLGPWSLKKDGEDWWGWGEQQVEGRMIACSCSVAGGLQAAHPAAPPFPQYQKTEHGNSIVINGTAQWQP